MTAGELIALADALRPNQYASADKLRWLRQLDEQIRIELLDTHEAPGHGEEGGSPTRQSVSPEEGGRIAAAPAEPRDDNGEGDAQEGTAYTAETELLVPSPWDEGLYASALFCRIDLLNAEIEKYNQSAALFAAAWRQYADFLNRSRAPRGERRWKL